MFEISVVPNRYFQTMVMSVFYLAIFAFVMTSCMDLLGDMVHLDPFLVGIVFAAAGTSFPNVFASMVVARQGALLNVGISYSKIHDKDDKWEKK